MARRRPPVSCTGIDPASLFVTRLIGIKPGFPQQQKMLDQFDLKTKRRDVPLKAQKLRAVFRNHDHFSPIKIENG